MGRKTDGIVAIATVICLSIGFAACHLAVMSVDLGSEYIKIAIVKPGVPMEIITNEESSRKTATIVAMRNGERFFGNAAENTATKFPSTAFWYLTQIIGKKFEDPAVAKYQERFPFYNLVKDEERGTVLYQVDEETQYSPEELIGMILEKARQYAEAFADQPIKDCVITVPAYFTQAERRAMLHAAELSSLNILQLMSDNAAVALNYGVFRRKQFTNKTQYFMFYDMGATSTTATIVGYQVVKMKEGTRVVENPQLTIKGVGFDKDLGGLEISMRLRDHLAKYFNEHKKTKKDLYSNERAMAKLLKEAKRVKKVLSANQEHKAQVEGLLDDEDFKMKVTRAELEEMCADMFAKVTKPIEDALKVSEVTLGELTDVILMGGGTRIPKVQHSLLEFLGRKDLGKSINTDEAAALGAVYQAAYLGKGFKVMTFGVKEAALYPVVVDFEKYRTDESVEPPKKISRTLFGRMNPFPQKKVMTFNKHFKDFSFNVTYGDLDFLPADEIEVFRELYGQIHTIGLKGVEDAYAKHKDAQEVKGIKAHFRMDESGILSLETVESVFETEQKDVKEESTWSKLGDTISGLFGSKDDEGEKVEEEQTDTKSDGEHSSDSTTTTQEPVTQTDQSAGGTDDKTPEPSEEEQGTDQPEEEASKEEEEEAKEEEEKKEPEEEPATEDKKEPEQEEQQSEKSKEEGQDGENKKEDVDQDKAEKKSEKNETKEEVEKKPKIQIVKENITSEAVIMDIPPVSKESLKASKKKLANLSAKDKEKKLLEKAKNELESFTYDMGDKLTQEVYEKCSTEEQREKFQTLLSEASDWLYEQDEDTKKEAFTDKLKSLKKEFKSLMNRVKEYNERPEALAALDSMLNHSSFFLNSIKNLSALNIEEGDSMFTAVEVETLEKLINETEEWKEKSIEEQSKLADHERPKFMVEDVALKYQALDREVKYLINKAKTYKPKSKPKSSKNETSNKNDTVIDKEESSKKEKTEDKTEETTSEAPDTESELPKPPTEESQDTQEDTQQTDDSTTTTTEKQTEKPSETNTHDAGDL